MLSTLIVDGDFAVFCNTDKCKVTKNCSKLGHPVESVEKKRKAFKNQPLRLFFSL